MVLLPSMTSQWKRLQDKGVSLIKPPCTAEAKAHHPSEDKQRLVIQSSLEQGSQLPPLLSAKDRKQPGQWENFMVKQTEGFKSARLEALRVAVADESGESLVTDLGSMLAFSTWFWVESRQKSGSWQPMTKSWLFGADFAVKVVAWHLTQASNPLFYTAWRFSTHTFSLLYKRQATGPPPVSRWEWATVPASQQPCLQSQTR